MLVRLLLPLLILCLGSIQTAHAARWFEIEILVFKRNVSPVNTTENWDFSLPMQQRFEAMQVMNSLNYGDVPTIVDGRTAHSGTGSFKILPSNQLRLKTQRNRLASNAAYQPLLHMGWQMPVRNSIDAKPAHLIGGKYFSDIPLKADESTGGPVFELDGLFRVYLQHYLYIESEFLLREPVSGGADGSSLDTYLHQYPFKQKRRVKSGQIHYFDHPLMGMFVQIRRM